MITMIVTIFFTSPTLLVNWGGGGSIILVPKKKKDCKTVLNKESFYTDLLG